MIQRIFFSKIIGKNFWKINLWDISKQNPNDITDSGKIHDKLLQIEAF